MAKSYELQLEDYWRIIRRHQILIIATCLVITGAIFFNSSKRPILY
ncbi:MAG: hypothetical protein HY609_04660, partial [Deltaproteobacteria bacterium]|nr:hypothetical protein [Deltaproteobacteria bacterium]